ncbi:MAG: hypothetical protein ACUVTL_00015 [Thermoproteota archaeon]
MKDFMFNPCYKPLEAAEIFERIVARASRLEYRFYGVNTMRLTELDRITSSSKIKGRKWKIFYRSRIQRSAKVIVEDIYGLDDYSRAIGMTQEEIEDIGKCFPLLLDIEHAAINFEMYRGGID